MQYTLVHYQFVFAALALRERIKVLNQFYNKIGDEPEKYLKPQILEAMMKTHDRLADGISMINSTFTLQV